MSEDKDQLVDNKISKEVPPDEQELKLLLVVKYQNKYDQVGSYLTRRGWPTRVVSSLGEMIKELTTDVPHFILLSVNHPHPKLRTLPNMLIQMFNTTIIMIGEDSSSQTIKKINSSKCKHKWTNAISGPSIHRSIIKLIMDEQKAEQVNVDKGITPTDDEVKNSITVKGSSEDKMKELLKFMSDNDEAQKKASTSKDGVTDNADSIAAGSQANVKGGSVVTGSSSENGSREHNGLSSAKQEDQNANKQQDSFSKNSGIIIQKNNTMEQNNLSGQEEAQKKKEQQQNAKLDAKKNSSTTDSLGETNTSSQQSDSSLRSSEKNSVSMSDSQTRAPNKQEGERGNSSQKPSHYNPNVGGTQERPSHTNPNDNSDTIGSESSDLSSGPSGSNLGSQIQSSDSLSQSNSSQNTQGELKDSSPLSNLHQDSNEKNSSTQSKKALEAGHSDFANQEKANNQSAASKSNASNSAEGNKKASELEGKANSKDSLSSLDKQSKAEQEEKQLQKREKIKTKIATEAKKNSSFDAFEEAAEKKAREELNQQKIGKAKDVSTLYRAVNAGVKESSDDQFKNGKKIGFVDQTKAISLRSEKLNGYLTITVPEGVYDNDFAMSFRSSLIKELSFLKSPLSVDMAIDIDIVQVEILEFADKEAKFSKKCFHKNCEIVVSFFEYENMPPSNLPVFKGKSIIEVETLATKVPVKFKTYIHLKKNDKFYLYLKGGRLLSEKQKRKLLDGKVDKLYIENSELDNYKLYQSENFLNILIENYFKNILKLTA